MLFSHFCSCQPALISYSGGTPPYYISVLPAGEVAATPIMLLPDQDVAGTYTWEVNLPEGINFTLSIRDGTGALNYNAPTVVQPGTSNDCVNATAASAVSSLGATAAVTGASPTSSSGGSGGSGGGSGGSSGGSGGSGGGSGGSNGGSGGSGGGSSRSSSARSTFTRRLAF
ncbi:hypothetical protein P389DRAFT_147671 [Cystobasidium minutum MCA 4210]|uniref:uncharacterized protein n=1 Tax=Cystobasidium minutum MCA 4210 TaxID=1397322 RepID=UPI0034CE98D6|eukprot:jgi/Rhomi1/147671/e_gw1.9.50.1